MPSACCCTVSPKPGQPISPAVASGAALRADRNSAHSVVQDRCAHSPNSSLYPHSPGERLAFSRTLSCRFALRLLLIRLNCSTTHSGKGQAELSQKTVREIKERHDRPT